jgi:hypothetical protein
MFFFKPKVIHLDCFTYDVATYNHFPIDYSHKFFPQWWKDLPKVMEDAVNPEKNFFGMNTAKTCTGINNFYANGITIPLWSDLLIRIRNEEITWQFADFTTKMTSHPVRQTGTYLDASEYINLKIQSPWVFDCKENINFMWTQHTWSFNKPKEIIIPPGIIDYKYQTSTNINFYLTYPTDNKQKDILMEAGQAMVNIVPLSERKLKIHRHVISKEQHSEKVWNSGGAFTFHNKYLKRKKIMKNNEKKCPFGF